MILPQLHPAQVAVQSSRARFRVIAAGRRFGKGVLGIGECVKRAAAGAHCWWLAPTFASAAFQSGWRMLEFYSSKIPGAKLQMQRRALSVGAGWVQFKTAEEPDSLRGESIDFAVVDEAAHVPHLDHIWELCLRPCLLDRKGAAWFISTPAGFNFFSTLWQGAKDKPGWASFRYPSGANPYLDAQELAEITRDMPLLVKRQEIDAEFVQLAGALFKRENVLVLEAEPPGVRWVRSWDLAWTKETTSDFTAGAKVGLTPDGTVVVAHMIHGRMEWPDAVKCISATAKVDGPAVRQGIEVVGAQAGALQTLLRDPMLVAHCLEAVQVTKDKLTRALPLVARSEQGKLAMVRGEWNQRFVDELCAFPESEHDDMVDAVTGAWSLLDTPLGFRSADVFGSGRPVGAGQFGSGATAELGTLR